MGIVFQLNKPDFLLIPRLFTSFKRMKEVMATLHLSLEKSIISNLYFGRESTNELFPTIVFCRWFQALADPGMKFHTQLFEKNPFTLCSAAAVY